LLRLFVLLITLFASASAFSNTEQANTSLSFDNTIELMHVELINSDLINKSAIPPITDAVQKPATPSTHHRSQATEFAQPVRANLLVEHIEQSPDYVFVEELLKNQLDVFADNETQLAQVPPCWFMHFSDNAARLSGWKDSNTLYSSKIDSLLS
jgi:hypothetical protein